MDNQWWLTTDSPPYPTDPEKWDNLFMGMAKLIATMSKCASRHVGAVVVRDKQILSMGYNGSPAGSKLCQFPPNAPASACPRKIMGYKSGEGIELCPAQHGEENTVANAAKNGISIAGGTIYCWCGLPCQKCAGAIINAGIKKVVCWPGETYDSMAKLLFAQAGVKIVYWHESCTTLK